MVQWQLRCVQLELTLGERHATCVPGRVLKLLNSYPFGTRLRGFLPEGDLLVFHNSRLVNSSSSQDWSYYLTVYLWLYHPDTHRKLNGFLAKEMGFSDLFNARFYGLKNQKFSEQCEESFVHRPLSSLLPSWRTLHFLISSTDMLLWKRRAFQHARECFPRKWGHQKHRAEKSQMALIFDFIFSILICSRWIGRLTSLTLLHHYLLFQLPLWMFFHKASPGPSEIDAWSPARVMLHYPKAPCGWELLYSIKGEILAHQYLKLFLQSLKSLVMSRRASS